jgi:hypothetical protein
MFGLNLTDQTACSIYSGMAVTGFMLGQFSGSEAAASSPCSAENIKTITANISYPLAACLNTPGRNMSQCIFEFNSEYIGCDTCFRDGAPFIDMNCDSFCSAHILSTDCLHCRKQGIVGLTSKCGLGSLIPDITTTSPPMTTFSTESATTRRSNTVPINNQTLARVIDIFDKLGSVPSNLDEYSVFANMVDPSQVDLLGDQMRKAFSLLASIEPNAEQDVVLAAASLLTGVDENGEAITGKGSHVKAVFDALGSPDQTAMSSIVTLMSVSNPSQTGDPKLASMYNVLNLSFPPSSTAATLLAAIMTETETEDSNIAAYNLGNVFSSGGSSGLPSGAAGLLLEVLNEESDNQVAVAAINAFTSIRVDSQAASAIATILTGGASTTSVSAALMVLPTTSTVPPSTLRGIAELLNSMLTSSSVDGSGITPTQRATGFFAWSLQKIN